MTSNTSDAVGSSVRSSKKIKECREHDWIEVKGKHGPKIECKVCGKFYGYLRSK